MADTLIYRTYVLLIIIFVSPLHTASTQNIKNIDFSSLWVLFHLEYKWKATFHQVRCYAFKVAKGNLLYSWYLQDQWEQTARCWRDLWEWTACCPLGFNKNATLLHQSNVREAISDICLGQPRVPNNLWAHDRYPRRKCWTGPIPLEGTSKKWGCREGKGYYDITGNPVSWDPEEMWIKGAHLSQIGGGLKRTDSLDIG